MADGGLRRLLLSGFITVCFVSSLRCALRRGDSRFTGSFHAISTVVASRLPVVSVSFCFIALMGFAPGIDCDKTGRRRFILRCIRSYSACFSIGVASGTSHSLYSSRGPTAVMLHVARGDTLFAPDEPPWRGWIAASASRGALSFDNSFISAFPDAK